MRRNYGFLGCVAALAVFAACGGDVGNGSPAGDNGAAAGDNGSDTGDPSDQCPYVVPIPGKVDITTLVPAGAADGPRKNHFRQDATHVYWASVGIGEADIMRVSKTGGQPERVTTIDESVFDFVVDPDGFIYFRTSSGVLSVPVTGGVAKPVWTLFIGSLWDSGVVAADAKDVYVPKLTGDCEHTPSPIYRVSKSSGDAAPFAEVTCPHEIALDDQYLYVSADGGGQLEEGGAVILGKYPAASLFRISKRGGSPELLAKTPYGLSSLEVTTSYVYGLLEEKGAPGKTVVRIPVAGGTLERLSNLSCLDIEQIRVSGDQLYFGDVDRAGLDGKSRSTFDVGRTIRSELLVDNGVVFDLGDQGILRLTPH
jgi:hypothetical protein